MRTSFSDAFLAAALENDRVCIIVADIGPSGSLAVFRDRFPDRYLNVGVAEQIMVGMSAGMAMRGFQPFIYTIATFSLYRPFEFVRDDLCYQNLPVTIVGVGGGVTYANLGATHHAQEDVALAMAIPNLSILAPSDPLEVQAMTKWCAMQRKGPVYLRLGKTGEPLLTEDAAPWQFGKIRRLRDGTQHCIVTYGVITRIALDVAGELESQGISTALVTVPTLKPLDRQGLVELFAEFPKITLIEESAPRGLGLELEALAFRNGYLGKVATFSLRDEFIHLYGTHDELLVTHELSKDAIVERMGLDA